MIRRRHLSNFVTIFLHLQGKSLVKFIIRSMLARKSVILAVGIVIVRLVFGLTFLFVNESAGEEFTSSSGQVSNERAASGNWSDEFCLPDDVDTLSQTLSPVIYTVIGGTGMLGVLLLTYACYRCHNRSLRVQHARYLATLPSPPQFPVGAAYIYRDDLRMILVNQN